MAFSMQYHFYCLRKVMLHNERTFQKNKIRAAEDKLRNKGYYAANMIDCHNDKFEYIATVEKLLWII